ncbi:hypothetical protein QBC44DRAFT_340827 [Cladorrhinum sp. PSN332]|nr:hypothetical protein QBC44DRAFT_340827 [Cladorrhinum sp. PSN332]
MRSSTICFGAGVLAGMANAACTPCGSVKCLGALAADPAVGESFCSSFLSLSPATTTVTEIETVTSTDVGLETAFTTLTVTTGTVTVTTGEPTTLFQKRAPTISAVDDEPAPTSSPDLEEEIVSKCSSNDARISKACNCFLSTATASTVTVTETSTSTEGVEATSTVVETVTADAVATVSVAPPAYTVPANIIVNGAFEGYTTSSNLSPWAISSTGQGNPRVEPIYPLSICAAGGDCPGGQVIIRVYPPTSGSGYTAMTETFQGRPSTTYNLSFIYRCLNYDSNTRIDTLYNGVAVSSTFCPNGNMNRSPQYRFTTDSTGRGELQVRFVNPSNMPYLYWYADDFKAIAV